MTAAVDIMIYDVDRKKECKKKKARMTFISIKLHVDAGKKTGSPDQQKSDDEDDSVAAFHKKPKSESTTLLLH